MLYQMWMLKNTAAGNDAFAKLPEAEKEEQNRALIAAHTDFGARPLIMCDCSWANEEYSNWGITRFPDLDSRIKQVQAMEKFGFNRYSESFTLLGNQFEDPQLANIQPGMIYCLWVVRNDPTAYAAYKALTQSEQAELWARHKSIADRVGFRLILRCEAYWANDAYRAFGVEAYPSLEAAQEFKAELLKIDWPMYIPGVSILGTLHPNQAMLDTVFGPLS